MTWYPDRRHQEGCHTRQAESERVQCTHTRHGPARSPKRKPEGGISTAFALQYCSFTQYSVPPTPSQPNTGGRGPPAGVDCRQATPVFDKTLVEADYRIETVPRIKQGTARTRAPGLGASTGLSAHLDSPPAKPTETISAGGFPKPRSSIPAVDGLQSTIRSRQPLPSRLFPALPLSLRRNTQHEARSTQTASRSKTGNLSHPLISISTSHGGHVIRLTKTFRRVAHRLRHSRDDWSRTSTPASSLRYSGYSPLLPTSPPRLSATLPDQ